MVLEKYKLYAILDVVFTIIGSFYKLPNYIDSH